MKKNFNDIGEGFNKFSKQVGRVAKDLGQETGKFTNDAARGTENLLKKSGKVAGELSDNMGKKANKVANNSSKIVKNVGESVGSVDLFSSKLRKTAINDYNKTVERYETVAKEVEVDAKMLYDLRKLAVIHVKYVEQHINQLANTPKEFKIDLQEINTEISTFENKEVEIKEAEKQARVAANGSGTGATLGALGIAVATMGPTAAMGVATTFGVASTGTAISALSGAAANSAALAWIGGGTLATGGGGITAGTALLGLAGPVGWTIAGVAGAAALGSGFFANHKNKETADKLLLERQNIEEIIRKFKTMDAEVKALIDVTQNQIEGVEKSNASLTGNDYSKFTKKEKEQAGLLVNTTLTLAQLINKELKLND